MKSYSKSDWILGKVLEDKARRVPDKVFIKTRNSQATYAEVDSASNRFANLLLRLGLKKNDKVCLMLNNGLEHIYCWFGCSKIGAVDVPINIDYKGQILEYIIDNSDASILVLDQQYLERIKFSEAKLKKLKYVLVIVPPGEEQIRFDLPFKVFNLNVVERESDRLPEVSVYYYDIETIIYTSGTTGPSKGVMQPYAQCYFFGWQLAKSLGLLADDIYYNCLPVFHSNARYACVYACLLAEAQVAMVPRFTRSGFWSDVHYFGATCFNILGAMAPLLTSLPATPEDAENTARLTWIAPVPEPYKGFEKRYGLKTVSGFGLTECCPVIITPLNEERPEGSCGKISEGFECRIVDEHDNEVPVGKTGEMIVRNSDPYNMFCGYYNMPEKTLECYRNLWFHTGDAMYRDKDGWYYFVDRIKDAIRRRAENISSYEVELVINSHPNVLESAVIAIKDLIFTEDEVKACVVLKPHSTLTPEDLISFCTLRMPYFHVPRYIEIMGSLPKTSTAKVDKAKLRECGLTAETWDREKAGIKIKR